jgi:hypothetical protein
MRCWDHWNRWLDRHWLFQPSFDRLAFCCSKSVGNHLTCSYLEAVSTPNLVHRTSSQRSEHVPWCQCWHFEQLMLFLTVGRWSYPETCLSCVRSTALRLRHSHDEWIWITFRPSDLCSDSDGRGNFESMSCAMRIAKPIEEPFEQSSYVTYCGLNFCM